MPLICETINIASEDMISHQRYICRRALGVLRPLFWFSPTPGSKLALINKTDGPLIAHQTAISDSDGFRHFKGDKLWTIIPLNLHLNFSNKKTSGLGVLQWTTCCCHHDNRNKSIKNSVIWNITCSVVRSHSSFCLCRASVTLIEFYCWRMHENEPSHFIQGHVRTPISQ